MTSQQFFLRWDNYSNHISYAFGTLRNQEDLVDVTLSCEGKKIRAHKVLLSACSSYFREVFKDNPCQHPVIVFKNVRFDDLLAIVEFMYQGEVSVVQDSLTSFLNTAELLSVQGLTENNNGNSNISSGGSVVANTVTSGTIIDTLTIPKTVTLKASPQQLQQAQQQQTLTLIPTTPTTTTQERRFTKKVHHHPQAQTTATTIKSVSHPITVFSPKAPVQATKRYVTTTTGPMKLTTTSHTQPPTLVATSIASMGDTLVDLQTVTGQPQILNTSVTTTSAGGHHHHQQVKRKRILFDSEENISIEDVNYVKQQMEMEMPDYIEIQTTTDGEKTGMVTVLAEDLISAESDSQQQQENVIIEESFDTNPGTDEDDEDKDKEKEMEITYTKDDQGNGRVVLTPVGSSGKQDEDKQQSVNIVQADGSNTKWSQCSYCKLVITSVNLWRHIRTQHTAQQPQICQYCSKNFKNKYSLREHIRIAHEKQMVGSAKGGETGVSGNPDEVLNMDHSDSELVLLKAESKD